MKKILVTLSTQTVQPKSQYVSAIKNVYLNKLNEVGLVPILVSGEMGFDVVDELYAICSGVLFPGGRDIDPSLYGESRHEKTQEPDQVRDKLESDILIRALNDKKPFLGICRGAQMTAVVNGGKLIQHLPDVVYEQHGVSEDASADNPDEFEYHPIEVVGNTKMNKIFSKSKLIVNSRHHQAVSDPGDLVAAAVSPGGVIEMVEHPALPFHVGIQSHPEASNDLDELFYSFRSASVEWSGK